MEFLNEISNLNLMLKCSISNGLFAALKKGLITINKDHHQRFDVPLLGQSVSINTWLVSGTTLCQVAGDAVKI